MSQERSARDESNRPRSADTRKSTEDESPESVPRGFKDPTKGLVFPEKRRRR